jgi:hypothetical protein
VQQPEQERCADQGGDYAHRDADGAGNGIGKEQEERSADCGEWQHGAWVGANGKTGKVRHHETNEPDEAGEGNGRGCGEGGERHGDAALTAHVNAEVRCRLVTEQEGGECAAATCEQQGGDRNWERSGGKARPSDAIETTKQEAEDGAQVRTTCEHHERERCGEQ